MKAIGSGGEWWWNLPSIRRKNDSRRRGRRNQDARGRRRGPPREPLSSSSDSVGQSSGWPLDFPFKQAVTAACLTLTGDTIAQVHRRIMDRRSRGPEADNKVTPLFYWYSTCYFPLKTAIKMKSICI
jgi:protein Mpv17